MKTAHITKNGQIAVPKDVLQNLHLRAGDTVIIETEPDGSIRLYPKTLDACDVAGMLKTSVKSTIQEMDNAIAEGFKAGRL